MVQLTNLVLEAWDTDTWQRESSLRTSTQARHRPIQAASQGGLAFGKYPPLQGGDRRLYNLAAQFLRHCGSDGVFRFFDVTKLNESPKMVEALDLQDQSDNVLDLAVSPDGRLAAAAFGVETTFRLWDMATRQPVETPSALPVRSRAQSPFRAMAGVLRPEAAARKPSNYGTSRRLRRY